MPQRQQSVGHPVDVASGALHMTRQDVYIPGMIDLVWDRLYSTAQLAGPATVLGPGWRVRYFATLELRERSFHFQTPDSGSEEFHDPEGSVERGGTVRNLHSFQE